LHGTRTGLQLVNQSFFLSVQVMGVRGKINLWYSKNKAKDSVGFGAPYKEIKYKKKKDKNKRNKKDTNKKNKKEELANMASFFQTARYS
jgi:hypothetical protein